MHTLLISLSFDLSQVATLDLASGPVSVALPMLEHQIDFDIPQY
jgi:hypothetical protein